MLNWKLILLLSLFGLAMAFATISLIPFKYEPAFWLVIFIICAYVIARDTHRNYFFHGLAVSLVNSIWITIVHVFFFTTYMANHPQMEQMEYKPLANHLRLNMVIMGPLFGLASGVVLGLFAYIATFIVKKKPLIEAIKHRNDAK